MNESWLADLLGYQRVVAPIGDGVEMPPRRALSFTGSVDVTDDPATGTTRVHITPASAGGGSTPIGLLAPVAVVSTADLPLSGLPDIDQRPTSPGDRVLAAGQASPADRGVYVASELGWLRAADLDESSELRGALLVPVKEGATYADQVFILTSDDPLTVGVSPLDFKPVGSGNATALRGVPLTALAPAAGNVLASEDGTAWAPTLVRDQHVATDAEIKVSKLKRGTAGQVLRSTSGSVVWGAITAGDLGESIISPDTLTTDQDNYSPGGWAAATVVRLDQTAPRTLRGLAPAPVVRRKLLVNVSGHNLTLAHDDGGQAAGHRILTPRQPFTLRPGQSATVIYDPVVSAWRAVDAQVPPDVAVFPTTWADLITFNGGFVSTGALLTGTAEYATNERARTPFLPLESGLPGEGDAGRDWWFRGTYWEARVATNSFLQFPLPYPRDSTCNGFLVGVANQGSVAARIAATLYKHTPNEADPSSFGWEPVLVPSGGDMIVAGTSQVLAPGEKASIGAIFLSAPINNEAHRYVALVHASNNGGGGDARGARVFHIKALLTDRGPRNG